MTGTLYVLRIADAKETKDKNGVKIFGVRFTSFLPDKWIHMPNTGPSPALLKRVKNLEKEEQWNETVFLNFYKPRYIQCINQPDAKKDFLTIKKYLDSNEDVYYACFCNNPQTCHRLIVKQIFKQKGYATSFFPEKKSV